MFPEIVADKAKHIKGNFRARGAPFPDGTKWQDIAQFLLDESDEQEGQKWTCAYCTNTVTAKDLVVDHCDPVDRGGRSEFRNLLPACKTCNTRKGMMTTEEYARLVAVVDSCPKKVQADVYRRLGNHPANRRKR